MTPPPPPPPRNYYLEDESGQDPNIDYWYKVLDLKYSRKLHIEPLHFDKPRGKTKYPTNMEWGYGFQISFYLTNKK